MTNVTKRLKVRDEGIDFSSPYSIQKAIEILQEKAQIGQGGVKFDQRFEAVFVTNLNPKKGDQNIRFSVQLPNGTGKTVRIAVFVDGDAAKAAKEAGADVVGGADLVEEVQNGRMDFDLCIATPSMMPLMGKLGKVLGPKGLMPNPKLGTVSSDVVKAVQSARSGQVMARVDEGGNIHSALGKLSFSTQALVENYSFFLAELLKLRPETLKGGFVERVFVSSTMGPSLRVSL